MHAVDKAIARHAAAQKELVTGAALTDAGLTRSGLQHRLRTGRLSRVHHRVYTTAHAPLTFEQRALAAVLACPGTRALGDGWAAGLWRMLSEPPDPPEVRREGEHRAGPGGVRVRRTARLEWTTHRGVPVTTPARTLLDLATTGPLGRLELALNEGFALRLVTRAQVEAVAATGARGAVALRTLLEDARGYTRQKAERLLRTLVLRAQLPRPTFNATVLGYEVDAHWPGTRLVVEVDGWATHGTRRAFEYDRVKDARLIAAGSTVMRVTWRQLTTEPEAVAARLGAALARAAATAA